MDYELRKSGRTGRKKKVFEGPAARYSDLDDPTIHNHKVVEESKEKRKKNSKTVMQDREALAEIKKAQESKAAVKARTEKERRAAAGQLRVARKNKEFTHGKPVAGEYTIRPGQVSVVSAKGKRTFNVPGIMPPTLAPKDGANRAVRRHAGQQRDVVAHPREYTAEFTDANVTVTFERDEFAMVNYTTLPAPSRKWLRRHGPAADDNYVVYQWDLSRVKRNALLHALNGNHEHQEQKKRRCPTCAGKHAAASCTSNVSAAEKKLRYYHQHGGGKKFNQEHGDKSRNAPSAPRHSAWLRDLCSEGIEPNPGPQSECKNRRVCGACGGGHKRSCGKERASQDDKREKVAVVCRFTDYSREECLTHLHPKVQNHKSSSNTPQSKSQQYKNAKRRIAMKDMFPCRAGGKCDKIDHYHKKDVLAADFSEQEMEETLGPEDYPPLDDERATAEEHEAPREEGGATGEEINSALRRSPVNAVISEPSVPHPRRERHAPSASGGVKPIKIPTGSPVETVIGSTAPQQHVNTAATSSRSANAGQPPHPSAAQRSTTAGAPLRPFQSFQAGFQTAKRPRIDDPESGVDQPVVAPNVAHAINAYREETAQQGSNVSAGEEGVAAPAAEQPSVSEDSDSDDDVPAARENVGPAPSFRLLRTYQMAARAEAERACAGEENSQSSADSEATQSGDESDSSTDSDSSANSKVDPDAYVAAPRVTNVFLFDNNALYEHRLGFKGTVKLLGTQLHDLLLYKRGNDRVAPEYRASHERALTAVNVEHKTPYWIFRVLSLGALNNVERAKHMDEDPVYNLMKVVGYKYSVEVTVCDTIVQRLHKHALSSAVPPLIPGELSPNTSYISLLNSLTVKDPMLKVARESATALYDNSALLVWNMMVLSAASQSPGKMDKKVDFIPTGGAGSTDPRGGPRSG